MTEVKFTNEIYQNELSPNDLEYDFNKHQPYYEFEVNGEKCYIGLDKILECVVIAEKIGEIPKIGISFFIIFYNIRKFSHLKPPKYYVK